MFNVCEAEFGQVNVLVNYVATKAAVEGLTRVLAKKSRPRRITANAVAPGSVGADFFLSGRSTAMMQRVIEEVPMARLGKPDDVARVVSFLASADGGWVSGQIIKANGGRN
ncbi:MAG: SDR family oxidoreductase [Rhodanobacter sp.]